MESSNSVHPAVADALAVEGENIGHFEHGRGESGTLSVSILPLE